MILDTKDGGCRGHGDVKEGVTSKWGDAMGDARDPWQQRQAVGGTRGTCWPGQWLKKVTKPSF